MRKKKMWKQVIGASVCLMMVLVSPNVQAANNNVASMKKVEEASVKPSAVCYQKVFNGKDSVVIHFNLGSGAEKAKAVTSVNIWGEYDGEYSYGALLLDGEYTIDYKKGTVTLKPEAIIDAVDVSTGFSDGVKFGVGVVFDDNEDDAILAGKLVADLNAKPEKPEKPEGQEIPWTDLTPAKPIEKPEKPEGQEIPWTDLTPAKPIEKPEKPEGQEIPWTDLTPAKPIENNHSTEQVKPNTTVSKDNISVADGNVSAAPKTSDTSDVVGLTSVGLGAFGLAVAELLRRLRK